MKFRILTCATVVVIIMFAVFGIAKRQSYTDVSRDENYLNSLTVAEMQTDLVLSNCNHLSQILHDIPFIIRVSTTEDVEHMFLRSRQKVCVEEVYAGEGVVPGDEIYLTSPSWKLLIDSKDNSIQRGFINILKADHEYLVFISQKLEVSNESIPVYELYSECNIAPVFCYEDFQNVIVPIDADATSTAIPYVLFKDNEFFAATEEGLAIWQELKRAMISTYPKSI